MPMKDDTKRACAKKDKIIVQFDKKKEKYLYSRRSLIPDVLKAHTFLQKEKCICAEVLKERGTLDFFHTYCLFDH